MGNKFDGILIPFFFDRKGNLGRTLGITYDELQLGPQNLKINFAHPTSEKLTKFGIFWLENCPESGPYSPKACSSWLMPRFSSMPGTYYQTSIRVRPTNERDGTPFDHDFIFWSRGKPASIGHQYALGLEISERMLKGGSVNEIVKVWQKEEYDMKFSRTIGELEKGNRKILGQIPAIELSKTKRRLELKARDASWKYKQPLVEHIA